METSPRFCENCGTPLLPASRFCGTCGTPVKPLPVPPAAPAQGPDLAVPPSQPESPHPPVPYFDVSPVPVTIPAPANFPPAYTPPQPGSYNSPLPQPDAFVPPPPSPLSIPYPQSSSPGDNYPTQQPPPPAVPGPVFYDERIVGVIPGATRKKGFLGMAADQYTLVVTNQRILFATLTKEITQQQVEQARQAAKAQGKGILSQWGAQLTTNVGQRYYPMDPQSILAEHPANFFYLNNQIRAVRISRYADNETFRTEYTLELDTVTGKVKLIFSMLNEAEVRALLSQTLGLIIR